MKGWEPDTDAGVGWGLKGLSDAILQWWYNLTMSETNLEAFCVIAFFKLNIKCDLRRLHVLKWMSYLCITFIITMQIVT